MLSQAHVNLNAIENIRSIVQAGLMYHINRPGLLVSMLNMFADTLETFRSEGA